MEMNEEKPSKFQFLFPGLLVPYLMKKKLLETRPLANAPKTFNSKKLWKLLMLKAH